MKKFLISVVIILGMIITSCNKEEPVLPNTTEKIESAPLQDDFFTDQTEDSTINENKAINSWIMNAATVNDIPTQMFEVDYKYKLSYQHLQQQSGQSYGTCSWTSYVLATAAIIKGNCNYCSYPVSYAKINAVRDKCVQQFGTYAAASQISSLTWYANSQDYSKISGEWISKSPSYRFTAIKYMLNHFATTRAPFLAITTYYYSNGTKGGHYLVVHGIDWKKGGTGSIVYYTDCSVIGNNSSYTANIKTMNFTTFLDRMIDSPSNYNMVLLTPKLY